MSEIKIDDYVQVRPPVKELMTRAIHDIKGPDRSMVELAEAAGISTSMLSRIVNGNYTKPISVEVLQKLASCAPEGCPVDLEILFDCNGMITKEEAARRRPVDQRRQRIIELKRRSREMRDIIADELFARGIAIKKLGGPFRYEVNDSKLFARAMVCDMAITLPDEEYIEWGFFMMAAIHEEGDTDREDAIYIRRIISNYAVIFLQDAWEPENSKHNKFSFGFVDEGFFNRFIDALEVAKLNNRMSAILINLKTRKVVKEYNFPCKNFSETGSLFDAPVHQEEEHCEDDFRQMTFFDGFNGEGDE